jgi:glutamyl-tRNA reductase
MARWQPRTPKEMLRANLDRIDKQIAGKKGEITELESQRAQIDKAIKALERGADPVVVVKELARLLTNKLIHSPSVQMKKASADGHHELIHLAEQLFELEASNEADSAPDPAAVKQQ